jgi:hypothetical protein
VLASLEWPPREPLTGALRLAITAIVRRRADRAFPARTRIARS